MGLLARRVCGFAAMLALGGCVSMAPAYHRPAPPIPAALPQGPAYRPAAEAAPGLPGWREVFTDQRLRSLIDLALADNRDLRVALANIRAARAQYRIQRADLLPLISAQGQETQGRVVQPLGPGKPLAFGERIYSAGVGFSAYELDLFGRVRSLSNAAQQQYLATVEARRAAQISLVAEVAGDWLTLDADKALLKIARETEDSGEASLRLTQRRFDGGIASQVDVAEAETVVEQARADVARYTTQAAQDVNALQLVVGAMPPEALLPDGSGAPGAVADVPAGVSSLVLLGRPDVLQAEATLKAANADIGAARAAFFPRITLTGQEGSTSAALSSLFSGPSNSWSFAPGISLPIFTGGANLANLDYAKAERDVAVAQYEKAVQTAFREAADALAQRGGVDEQLAAQQALADSAAKSLRLSMARYERGSDTYLNTLVAQRTLYAAQQSLIAARLARSTSLVNQYKALGGGAG